MSRQDIYIIIIVLAIAAAAWGFISLTADQPTSAVAIISVNGRQLDPISLNADQTLQVDGALGACTVEVKDGAIRMLEADCPDKICSKTGFISQSTQSIACVPNKIVITISNHTTDKEIDYILR